MSELQQAAKLKKELDNLRPLSPEDEQRIMQKFRLDWNFHSNHLEGNSLTYGETKALILFGITAQGKPLKDHFEITGHDEAVKWVSEIIKEERPLTENFIRELHKLILKESYKVPAETADGKPSHKIINPGEYKTSPNHVRTKTGEIFYFATPEETPAKMHDLVNWYRAEAEKEGKNAVILAAEFHYKFIRIHPFDDGNGRTARILMNFILMRGGYPPVVIKTEDKQNYFAALRQADADLFEPFSEYIAKNLNRSLELMIRGAKGESVEEPDDIEKEIALLEQKLDNAGSKIEITKTIEAITKIAEVSLQPLADEFIRKCGLLDKFYMDKKVLFISEGKESQVEEIFQNLRLYTKEWESVIFSYFYEALNRANLSDFDFQSRFIIKFNHENWKITNRAGTIIQKNYNEQLTQKEIETIINAEIRRHKKAIETQIEQASKLP